MARARAEDARGWLKAHGHADVVAMIDAAVRRWAAAGKKTRRNWWDVLAGTPLGRPRRVLGVSFPVIAAARRRQQRKDNRSRHRQTQPQPHRANGHGTSPATGVRAASVDGGSRPFVKWAGGKRQLLATLLAHVPERFGSYHEPFVGGGALFFALSPSKSFLSDSNERLMRCYRGIKDHVGDVIALLKGYRRDRRFFQVMRERDIDQASDPEVAAWFIYLNKTGYNGLYRVNSKNRFNVPFGDSKNAQICDEENLRACSRALAHATLACEDFEAAMERARSGDLVYLDPPYVPLSTTSYFTAYTAQGFGQADQIRLRDAALRLKQRGVHVLLSNSSSAEALYSDKEFSLKEVQAARLVNSKAERRGKITELLIR